MESLRIFEDFKLADLEEKWTRSVWESQFTVYNDPPDDYLMFLESERMRLLLLSACSTLKAWLSGAELAHASENEGADLSWSALIASDVKVQALLATLGYIMKRGQSKEADEDSRQSCFYATSLYFLLLAIPGCTAFNAFHPILYEKSVETMKMSRYLLPVARKHGRATNVDSQNTCEEWYNDDGILTSSEKILLVKSLNGVLCDFNVMIRSFWFKDHAACLDIAVRGLLELTKVDSESVETSTRSKQRNTPEQSLSEGAYATLLDLCQKKHGPVDITIVLIAKHALPQLICSHTDAQAKLLLNKREAIISFLKRLLNLHEKDAKSAFTTLAQHLMVHCPDRLEARQKQAVVLLKFLSVCKQDILVESFKDILLLAHHCKISCRVFAQEIIGRLLIEFFTQDCQLNEILTTRTKTVLVAAVLSRLMDSSSMVRGKAAAILAEFTGSGLPADRSILQSIFQKPNREKSFSTYHELTRALQEDVDPMPGSDVLIGMLKDRIEDERALIRRSTLQIYQNLAFMLPALTDKLIQPITNRCRDPMQTVRRFAIQVASQLLQRFPGNDFVLEEWVRAVVPRIFDVEAKVQEKVLEYLQVLLLNEIGAQSSSEIGSKKLPWDILDKLTSMKMRKHLSKACDMWVKSGVITKSVIANIQSHIETRNNIQAWVFLAALAENTALPNLNKYVSNYKELLEENDFHSNLVLQVLRYSWQSLSNDVLISLRIYLLERLEQFKISFSLISASLDIVNSISGYMNCKNGWTESTGSSMERLMNLSESEIKKILKKEAVNEAAAHYLRVIFTLGHALLFCTAKISPLTLRILEGILLEWETLPDNVREIEQLQAFAVIILGQQAMRDREIAQEVVPIFGKLMRQETDIGSRTQVAVKINSAKALADVCIRFTALVEPYLPDMCVSMKDASPDVREAIIVVFIQLLLEDFVKVKGPFFFHVLTMLFDTDDTIRELTVFLIEERLLVKNKTLISQQFLESIYHYNNYQPAHRLLERKMREKEKKALTLPGKRNEQKRRIIYNFMLEHLDPPGKIKLLVKLTSQILAGTCEDLLDVNKEEGTCVLKDALFIISNERLQPSNSNRQADDQDQEESTVQPNTVNAVNVIADGMKKHGLEVLLPILIRLANKLSITKSSMENEVKRLLVKTYSEYNKDQLSNILNEYPDLERNIDNCRRQLESQGEECKSPKMATPVKNVDEERLKVCKMSPRVVLRRLSTSHVQNGTMADLTFSTSVYSEHPSGSSAANSAMAVSPAQSGPSASTPKSHKHSNPDRTPGHVTKARRLTAFFQDVETSSGYADCDGAKRSVVRKGSESD